DHMKMRLMNNFDIIFCCNVLIYFDQQSKIQVVSDLYDSLNPGGFLFIGYAETLHGISSAFKLINFPKTVAYKKE
ncbi:MAG TPA: CheR family methyltransferase, partial [Bacteroidota bacterium]|nr:CheR family methyltransferase [Bacteroidota bacterium]